MRLAGNLYITRTLEAAENGFKATVEMCPDHPVYKGHFPNQPVVPGVFTLAVVRECAAAAAGYDVEYAEIKECKFISALIPGERVILNLDFTFGGNQKLSGAVTRDGDVILKLKATLR